MQEEKEKKVVLHYYSLKDDSPSFGSRLLNIFPRKTLATILHLQIFSPWFNMKMILMIDSQNGKQPQTKELQNAPL